MKAMKGAKAMSKSGITTAVDEDLELDKGTTAKVLDAIAELGVKELKKTGKFTFPGLAMIKTRLKPATKACKKEIFGKMCTVKAKPARTVVKAFAVKAVKDNV